MVAALGDERHAAAEPPRQVRRPGPRRQHRLLAGVVAPGATDDDAAGARRDVASLVADDAPAVGREARGELAQHFARAVDLAVRLEPQAGLETRAQGGLERRHIVAVEPCERLALRRDEIALDCEAAGLGRVLRKLEPTAPAHPLVAAAALQQHAPGVARGAAERRLAPRRGGGAGRGAVARERGEPGRRRRKVRPANPHRRPFAGEQRRQLRQDLGRVARPHRLHRKNPRVAERGPLARFGAVD